MAVRYAFDPAQSRFTVHAFAAGMLSALAHSPTFAIRDFEGEMQFDPDAPAETSLQMSVKADSLDLLDTVKPQDRAEIESRMRQEVLETTNHPQIVFQSVRIDADRVADGWYRLRLAGELSLHGVRRPQQLDAQLRLIDDQIRLSGRFAVAQSAYRIKQVSALAGAIKLKDELTIDFELLGRVAAT